jgi:GxxExxY protein
MGRMARMTATKDWCWAQDDERRSLGMAKGELFLERLTHSVIGAFFEVYNDLGFGFLEQIYVGALAVELRRRGHVVDLEVGSGVTYKGVEVGSQRLDMVVDKALVVEVKSTIDLHSSARRQLLNYLRATHLELGLLLHFGPKARFYRLISTQKHPRGSLSSAKL